MSERPDDLNLPAAVVARIAKDAIPPQIRVTREANAAIAKAASVFVLYATSSANNVAVKANRKTLTGSDVIRAMVDMEFDKFVPSLEQALESWRAGQAKKKAESAQRKKEKTSAEAARRIDEDDVEIIGCKTIESNKENEDDDDFLEQL